MLQQTKIQINTRKPVAVVRKTIESLPATLAGDAPDNQQLRTLFLSHFTKILLTRIHTAFLEKSHGNKDDLGFSWKPLAQSTVDRKKQKRSKRAPEAKDALKKSQKGNWTRFFNQSFKAYRTQGYKGEEAINAARRQAWLQLQHSKPGSPDVLINRDTERLQKSIAPGTLSGVQYQPPAEQKVVQTRRGVEITFEVPYATYVHRARRLYPPVKSMRPWAIDSLEAATVAVVNQIKKSLE